MSNKNRVNATVCYVTAEKEVIRPVLLPPNSTMRHALTTSGILLMCPEIDLDKNLDKIRIGVYGRFCALDQLVTEGDRIEIYRPVTPNGKQRVLNRG